MRSIIRKLGRRLSLNPVDWVRDTRRMRKLVAEFDSSAPEKSGAVHFAIVLVPWMGTAVPWFSMVTGLFLAAQGNRVSFIVDDMPFGGHVLSSRFQVHCIRSVLKVLGNRHRTVTLSAFRSGMPLDAAALKSIERLAELNAVWALRGEMKVDGRQLVENRAMRQLVASYTAIRTVVQQGAYDAVFVPGGVWGSSGIWIEHALAAGVRVASYDSGGYGNLLLAVNGIACQLQDIPRAFRMLRDHAAANNGHEFIEKSALAEIDRRRAGVDKFASQVQGVRKTDARFDGAVLIALNSSWDSAALGLHVVFETGNEWIVATVRHVLERTNAPVIVRQHPVERLEIASTTDDYRSLLQKNFGNHHRLHFIAADEAVNSYDLLEQVAAVVVYTSTIGIEAAAHGKPVITASRSYYSDMGFVWKASNVSEYAEHLSAAVAGRLEVTETMREAALYCYYITQCCNWIFTPFTVPEFHEWMHKELRQLSEEASVKTVVQALEQNTPVAFLNHLSRIAPPPAG
jgi:hypothetical protein